MDCFEAFKNKTETGRRIRFCKYRTRVAFKEKFDKLKCEINQLRDKKLYMEVYQPRENLRFLGIKEADMEEDVREVWLDSLKQSLVWKMQTKSNSKGSMLESVFLPMVDLDKLSHVF